MSPEHDDLPEERSRHQHAVLLNALIERENVPLRVVVDIKGLNGVDVALVANTPTEAETTSGLEYAAAWPLTAFMQSGKQLPLVLEDLEMFHIL